MKNQPHTNVKINPLLLDDIVNKFGVSQEFVFEYQNLLPQFDWNKTSWDVFLESLPPLYKMYASFAMSTVLRGRYFFSLLNMYACIQTRNRYLDIGTAYAGFLCAFKEQGFNEVVGIELQEHLARLGRANIQRWPDARILVGDFLRDDYSSLGTFDVVTCNDVIEHVDDAVLALQKMSRMVKSGGCLALEVPNRDCISFVKSDGHFQIFGITQLQRDDAADYYAAVSEINLENLNNSHPRDTKKNNYLFEMGEMYILEWYIDKLSNNGMSVVVADTHRIGKVKDVPGLCMDLKNAYTEWRENIAPRLEYAMIEKIEEAIETYLFQCESDFLKINDEVSQKRFEDKYLRSFWTLLAFKEKDRSLVVQQKISTSSLLLSLIQSSPAPQDTRASLLWKLARPFRFLKRFMRNPGQAMIDLVNFLRLR